MEANLKIPSRVLDQMLAHARAGAPLETCGVLGGRENCALEAYPIANALRSPVRYRADPKGLLAAFLDIEAHGWDIVAIYHSHPAGPDSPSTTDVAEAYYPEAVYVIISLASLERGEPPLVRGFRIVGGQVSQVAIVCE